MWSVGIWTEITEAEELGEWNKEKNARNRFVGSLIVTPEYSKVCPGFVSIKYGETHRHGNDCHDRRSLYSQIPRNRSHGTSRRATWGSTSIGQEAEREVGRAWPKAFTGGFG